MSETSEDAVSIYFLLFSWLLAGILILSRQLHKFPTINNVVSEAALVLLIGITVSFLVETFFVVEIEVEGNSGNDGTSNLVARSLLSFRPNIFFMALLPPILFNSGYQLRRELFWRHFTPISLFACVGTIISAFGTGLLLYFVKIHGWLGNFGPTTLELMTFGSLIAATDTVSTIAVFQAKKVDPHLFYLVFGESALNDAVALILFKTLSDFLLKDLSTFNSILHASGVYILHFLLEAVCSPVLGIVCSFVAALVFKHADMKDTIILELCLYILMMYIPFIIAEYMELSGIVSIFFTGMFARRYIEPNVSDSTKESADTIFKLTSYLAETCIFLELGLSVFGFSGKFEWAFVFWAFFAALLGRGLAVYPIAFFYNFSLKQNRDSVIDNETAQQQLTADDSIGDSNDRSMWKNGLGYKTPEKRRDQKISIQTAHILWLSGLRGAVAYACAKKFPDTYGHKDEFIAATIFIVLMSIVVMGGATGPLLLCLGVPLNVDEDEYMEEWHKQRELKGHFHSFENNIFQVVVKEGSDELTMHESEVTPELGYVPVALGRKDSPRSRETEKEMPHNGIAA